MSYVVWLGGASAAFVVIERLLPRHPQAVVRKGIVTDLAYLVFNGHYLGVLLAMTTRPLIAHIDVLLMKQVSFDAKGKASHTEIDESFADEAESLHNELVENIAENDESLMELYFEKGSLTEEEMRSGLREAMVKRQLFPIFLTSDRR